MTKIKEQKDKTLRRSPTIEQYLGVNIYQKLNWNTHIQQIEKKANATRAFLQRNIYLCPRKTKELCYTTPIRPIIEYGSIIWDPHTTQNINRLEMVQRDL